MPQQLTCASMGLSDVRTAVSNALQNKDGGMRAISCLIGTWLFWTLSTVSGSAEAQQVSCSKRHKLKSTHAKQEVEIRFVNDTGEPRSINWIDYKGKLVQYSLLGPGKFLDQSTFRTHPWFIADKYGNCLGIFLPKKRKALIELSKFGSSRKSARPSRRTFDCKKTGKLVVVFKGSDEVVLSGNVPSKLTLKKVQDKPVPLYLQPGKLSDYSLKLAGTGALVTSPKFGEVLCTMEK